jgi:hypothetical protein
MSWLLAPGSWQPAACRWQLAAGRWPLAAGRSPLAGGRWPVASCQSPVARDLRQRWIARERLTRKSAHLLKWPAIYGRVFFEGEWGGESGAQPEAVIGRPIIDGHGRSLNLQLAIHSS